METKRNEKIADFYARKPTEENLRREADIIQKQTERDKKVFFSTDLSARNPVEYHKHAVEDGRIKAWINRNLGLILWFASAALMLSLLILILIELSGCGGGGMHDSDTSTAGNSQYYPYRMFIFYPHSDGEITYPDPNSSDNEKVESVSSSQIYIWHRLPDDVFCQIYWSGEGECRLMEGGTEVKVSAVGDHALLCPGCVEGLE